MNGKPKISPTHTYVFDESDLEQFDELSLSAVMESVDLGAEPGRQTGHQAASADVATETFELAEFEIAEFGISDFDATQTDIDDLEATVTDLEFSIDSMLEEPAPGRQSGTATREPDEFEELISPEELLLGSDDS